MSTVVDPNTQEHKPVDHAAANTPGEPEVLTCPNCSAPGEPGQLMCLECGSRLALDYERPRAWRLAAAIGGVVVLLAGLGVAIALAAGGNDSKPTAAAPTAAAPTAPAATQPAPASPGDAPPTASQPTPAPASSTTSTTPTPSASAATSTSTTPSTTPTPSTTASGWPAGRSAYTIVLASLPSKSDANAKLDAAKAAGITSAAILHSDDFPTLRPGYWVVFDGQYDSIEQAQSQAAADRAKGDFSDAYPRFVSSDANATP